MRRWFRDVWTAIVQFKNRRNGLFTPDEYGWNPPFPDPLKKRPSHRWPAAMKDVEVIDWRIARAVREWERRS